MSAPVAQTRPLHTFKSAHTRTLAMNRMSPLELFGQLPVELRLIILLAFPNIFVGGENYTQLKNGSVKKNKRNIDIWFTRNFESYAPKEIHVCATDGLPLNRREMRTTPPAERAVKKVWEMVGRRRGGRISSKYVYAQLKPSEAIRHPDWEQHSKMKFHFAVFQKERCSETSPFDLYTHSEVKYYSPKYLGAEMYPRCDAKGEGAARIHNTFTTNLRKKHLNTPKRVKDILSGAKTLTYTDVLIAGNAAYTYPLLFPFLNHPVEWFYEDGTPITQL